MIGEMQAGPELDRAIAERVFGLTVVADEVNYRGMSIGKAGRHGLDVPEYSRDIAAAWTVAERMRELGWFCTIMTPFCDREGFPDRGLYEVCIGRQGTTMAFSPIPRVKALHPALAICRAALVAAGRPEAR